MGFKNNFSPLRYPGGKAAIADFFVSILAQNGISSDGTYCEPFAGGAGVALTLLMTGHVKQIILNDLDPCIAAFWYSVLYQSEALIKLIEDTMITLEEWEKQRQIYESSKQGDDFLKLGFATFFLNRCNRAGILPKAGPIGGRSQSGKYKLDARFKKDILIERIRRIASMRNHIKFTSMDAELFLDKLPEMQASFSKNTFLYLDPPYFHNGHQLYLNSYTHEDHISLAKKLSSYSFCPWIMTYDDCREIRKIYEKYSFMRISSVAMSYSMQNVRVASELLIVPPHTIYYPSHTLEMAND